MEEHQIPVLEILGSNPSRVGLFVYKTLLDSIFYWYYSKDLQAKKSDNKGIRLIKKYVFKIYKLMKETLKEASSEDEQDA